MTWRAAPALASQLIRAAVEIFGGGGDEAFLGPLLAQVAGDLFDTEEVWFGLNDPVDFGPEVGLGAFEPGPFAPQEVRETIDYGLVVDKDVHWSFGGGDEVQHSEGFWRDIERERERQRARERERERKGGPRASEGPKKAPKE